MIHNLLEQRLLELLPLPTGSQKILVEAARYAVLGGGKRLRPSFLLATVETLGVDPHIALDVACAMEFIHNYSLIHDDLPCMDNDDWRRGKPSLHRAYKEEVAVLAGDYLLTTSFQVLSQAPYLLDQQKVHLISLFSQASAECGLLGGQILDLCSPSNPMTLESLSTLYEMKTGALFRASLEGAAIIANATPLQKLALKELGSLFGIAFQIRDDLEDFSKESCREQCNILRSLSRAESLTYLNTLYEQIDRILIEQKWKETPLGLLIASLLQAVIC